jgi:sugar phosphate isomerase/epimerase
MTRLLVSMAGSAVELNKDVMSIGTTFNYDIPLREQLPLIARVGFRYVSLGARVDHSGYLSAPGRQRIKKMVASHGLRICSLHTPFGKDIDISSPNPVKTHRTIECYKRCIDAAQYLSARVVIFHPTAYMQFDDLDSRKKAIMDNVARLLDYVRSTDISLAIENEHFTPANDILKFSLDTITDSKYGFCYDTSHDNLTNHPLKIFQQYGHRLLTTHISDNRGKQDDHMLPCEGSFPWMAFCRTFSRIRFSGIFLLEVEMRESAFGSPGEFLQEAFARGQRLLSECRKT